jgi:hypothetical protein
MQSLLLLPAAEINPHVRCALHALLCCCCCCRWCVPCRPTSLP